MSEKICLGAFMLLLFTTTVKAQSVATLQVSANIISPVELSPAESGDYTSVAVKTGNNRLKDQRNKFEMTVADFKLDAAKDEVYSITVPAEMALRNNQGSSCITAVVNPLIAGQILPGGQKQFTVDSEITLGNEPVQGKHSSTPFEVTVNFN